MTKRLGALLVIFLAISVLVSGQAVGRLGRTLPMAAPASSLTAITASNLSNLGAFKVPTTCGGEDLQFSATGIAYYPAGNSGAGSLFIMTHGLNLAELSIPALVTSSNPASLNTATCLRLVTDPTDGLKAQANVVCDACDSSGKGQVTDLTVIGSTLVMQSYIFYDGSATARLSVVTRPADLTITGQTKGLYGIGTPPTGTTTDWVPGMATNAVGLLSSDWTSAFGGDLITGAFAGSIQTRLSWGPNLTVIDSSVFTNANGVDKTTISAANADNSFNDSANGLPSFPVGAHINYFDRDFPSTDTNNNKPWVVVSSTSSKVVVSGGTVATVAAGNGTVISRVYPAVSAPLYGTQGRGMTGPCGGSTAYNILASLYAECGDGRGGSVGSTTGTNYKDWSQSDYNPHLIQPTGTNTVLACVTHGSATSSVNPNSYGYSYGCDCTQTNLTFGSLTCNGADPGGCGASGEGYWYDDNFGGAKGPHSWPYTYHMTAYRMTDLQAVLTGATDPRDVLPYTSWDWTFPIMPGFGELYYMAATYDTPHNRIVWAQIGPNSDYPIFNVIQVTP